VKGSKSKVAKYKMEYTQVRALQLWRVGKKTSVWMWKNAKNPERERTGEKKSQVGEIVRRKN